MKQLLRKLLCFALVLSMILALSAGAFAVGGKGARLSSRVLPIRQPRDPGLNQIAELNKAKQMFSTMSIAELNRYIDSTAAQIRRSEAGLRSNGAPKKANDTTVLLLKKLWLASAQIARLLGYPCSAKLIECSVMGVDYQESVGRGGLFREKIVATKTYQEYIAKIRHGTYTLGKGYVLSHSKSENRDLYYSLHACTYVTTKDCISYHVTVTDTYDFALMNYDDIFSGIVNNWAWLCQYGGVLQNIRVSITFKA